MLVERLVAARRAESGYETPVEGEPPVLDLPDDRNELKEMCARAGVPYSPKDALERVKNRLRKAPPSTVLHSAAAAAVVSDDDPDMSNGHGNGHGHGRDVDGGAARARRRASAPCGRRWAASIWTRRRSSSCTRGPGMQPRRARPARRPRRGSARRPLRARLPGEDVSDDDATLRRRRAALKGAYEEEEEEEESEDDEAAPEAIDNRLPKRFGGRPRFPSRRARDWALDDAAGARDRDVASLGAAMARAVGRWASRSEEDDFAYHMRRARGVPRWFMLRF